jgi:hypothetical protein
LQLARLATAVAELYTLGRSAMRIKTKIVVVVFTLFVVAIVLSDVLFQRGSLRPASAIYHGSLSSDRTNLTFWVSNSTPNLMVVDLGPIEVRNGTDWRQCPIWTDKPSPQIDSLLRVLPYTATQKQITVITPLQPSSWRLKVVEAQALAGPERYFAGLRWHYKSRVALTTNSFANSTTWLGHHRQVIIYEAEGVSE